MGTLFLAWFACLGISALARPDAANAIQSHNPPWTFEDPINGNPWEKTHGEHLYELKLPSSADCEGAECLKYLSQHQATLEPSSFESGTENNLIDSKLIKWVPKPDGNTVTSQGHFQFPWSKFMTGSDQSHGSNFQTSPVGHFNVPWSKFQPVPVSSLQLPNSALPNSHFNKPPFPLIKHPSVSVSSVSLPWAKNRTVPVGIVNISGLKPSNTAVKTTTDLEQTTTLPPDTNEPSQNETSTGGDSTRSIFFFLPLIAVGKRSADIDPLELEPRSDRIKREFVQNYQPGAQSTHIDCNTANANGCAVQHSDGYGNVVNGKPVKDVASVLHGGEIILQTPPVQIKNIETTKPQIHSEVVTPALVQNVEIQHVDPVTIATTPVLLRNVELQSSNQTPVQVLHTVETVPNHGHNVEFQPSDQNPLFHVQNGGFQQNCFCRTAKQFFQVFLDSTGTVNHRGTLHCNNDHCQCQCFLPNLSDGSSVSNFHPAAQTFGSDPAGLVSQFPSQFSNVQFLPFNSGKRTAHKKRSTDAQFHQTYHSGSSSQNIDCGPRGCHGLVGPQQIHNSRVFNTAPTFNQGFHGGSHATNFGHGKKRSVKDDHQFNQTERLDSSDNTDEGAHIIEASIFDHIPSIPTIGRQRSIIDDPHPWDVSGSLSENRDIDEVNFENEIFRERFINGNEKKRSTDAQFFQTYHRGSTSQNIDCGPRGCFGLGGPQQIHNSQVLNSASTFNQGFFGGSSATNIAHGKKRSADSQFFQNYLGGSTSQNVDCGPRGCLGLGGPQQIHNSQVLNSGSSFNQGFFGGSSAFNFGQRKKRFAEPQFIQNYLGGSSSQNINCGANGCHGISGPQQIDNSQVFNSAETFNQEYFGGSSATNFDQRKKRFAEPQFFQNYLGGSTSQNINCGPSGCHGIGGPQQIYNSQVLNSAQNFNQDYFGGSSATNFAQRKKRSADSQFIQNYQAGSHSQNINCGPSGCHGISGPQQVYDSQVFNSGTQFNQDYFGESQATNFGKKRSVDYVESGHRRRRSPQRIPRQYNYSPEAGSQLGGHFQPQIAFQLYKEAQSKLEGQFDASSGEQFTSTHDEEPNHFTPELNHESETFKPQPSKSRIPGPSRTYVYNPDSSNSELSEAGHFQPQIALQLYREAQSKLRERSRPYNFATQNF